MGISVLQVQLTGSITCLKLHSCKWWRVHSHLLAKSLGFSLAAPCIQCIYPEGGYNLGAMLGAGDIAIIRWTIALKELILEAELRSK